MALFISFRNRRSGEGDFIRFKTAITLFSELFRNLRVNTNSTLVYKYDPLPELNENFERKTEEFGLLESYIRNRVELEESKYLGMEIEATIIVEGKNFKLIFNLLPSYRGLHYDIKIELMPNKYAEIFEDLERYNLNLREIILQRIKDYNKDIEFKKNKELFTIRRAVMSDYNDELHNIDQWRMFYSKEPSELIIHISSSSPELNERLVYANRKKFAESLNEFEPFIWRVAEYAKEAEVKITGGSISIIPKNEESMKKFVGKLREKISLAAKEIYPTKEEYEQKLGKSFSD